MWSDVVGCIDGCNMMVVIHTDSRCALTAPYLTGMRSLTPISLVNFVSILDFAFSVVLATGPNSRFGSRSGPNPEPNRWNRFPHKTRHFNISTLRPIKYLSSDRIKIWSVHRLCISSRSFTSPSQICDLTNIRWVAIETPLISLKFALFSQPLNAYQSDCESEWARSKSGQNSTIYILITSRYDENSNT